MEFTGDLIPEEAVTKLTVCDACRCFVHGQSIVIDIIK